MSIAATTLAKAFESQALRYGTRAFLSTKADQQWRDYSWADVADRAKRLRTGLIHLGIKTGDRLAILSENSPEWVIVDQAVLGLGAIVVPLYTTSGAEEMRHVLNDSGARIVAVNGDRLIEKVQGLGGLDQLEGILAMHPGAVAQDESGLEVITIEQLSAFEATRAVEGNVEDLATFIYTSGTTGVPKGVMLSHGNLIANCESNLAALDMNEHELLLSFLPVAHSFERTAGYYTMMMAGGTIAYAEGLGTIAQNLLEIEPTLVLVVPRLLEMIYDRVNRT
ncbi:MAG TPA: AMP-binding protein, partial [Candidatus Binataceae bacterium]|nr:AMP-binding protein [Candidatus Binataceae bacterium]